MATLKQITLFARELRKNQTVAEQIMWQILRNRKYNKLKFYRQYPIIYEIQANYNYKFFIPDFYCHEAKLVIELDGKIHDFQKEYDYQRDLILKEKELTVLRFKNEEILNEIDKVLAKINKTIGI
ncbi:MAG: hypothetical protein A2033_02330 [Bacteroidetes bacterium GWA2_31_9]|nr:MAG: hypothetical protein A2033_02330 [Bacteroidetes bacterium GWA2_31_9]